MHYSIDILSKTIFKRNEIIDKLKAVATKINCEQVIRVEGQINVFMPMQTTLEIHFSTEEKFNMWKKRGKIPCYGMLFYAQIFCNSLETDTVTPAFTRALLEVFPEFLVHYREDWVDGKTYVYSIEQLNFLQGDSFAALLNKSENEFTNMF